MSRQRPRKPKPPAQHAATHQGWLTPARGRAILTGLLLIFTLRAYSSLRQESATWDETVYFGLGKYLLQTQRWDVPGSILHPPLSYYLHSLPLLFVETDPQPWKYNPPDATDPRYLALSDAERGQALLSTPANAEDRLLTMARMMMVATGVLCGLFVYMWSRSLYGTASGLVAAALFTLDPNILAHARLITPDIVLTTFSFIAMYAFWRLMTVGQAVYGLWAGAALGLALLSKFTGALMLPIMLVVLTIYLLTRRSNRINWIGIILMLATGALVLAMGYGFHLGPYFTGFAFQQQHASDGHPSFLMGEYSRTGWWNYFLVAFAIKTPVATLVLIGAACLMLMRTAARGGWLNEACLIVPVIGIAGFFTVNHQSIGLRYLLPIYPFLFVFASRAAALVAGGFAGRVALGGLLAWVIGASLWIQPHYLAYFNEIIGGPSQGYRYLVDSNLDWGQDLPALKHFMDEHSIARVHLSYFGSDEPGRYGIAYDPLPSYLLKGDTGASHPLAIGSWVAISATNLQGVYFTDKAFYARFRDRPPDAVLGYSLFLYQVK